MNQCGWAGAWGQSRCGQLGGHSKVRAQHLGGRMEEGQSEQIQGAFQGWTRGRTECLTEMLGGRGRHRLGRDGSLHCSLPTTPPSQSPLPPR